MQKSKSQSVAHVMWGAVCPGGGGGAPPPPARPPLAPLTNTLATDFHRFLARFSGRRRIWPRISLRFGPPWALVVLVATTLLHMAEACSSRTTPKPRPPAPTPRPNITFHTYVCPPAYATWYCLNGATCFTVKIGDSLLYNCECADGYMGPRCEYKDLDGSYLPSQRRFMLETASIAGGVVIAALLVVVVLFFVYVHYKRKTKAARTATDCVDGPGSGPTVSLHRQPTFGTRWKHHHHQQHPQQQHPHKQPHVDQPLACHDGGGGDDHAKTDLHQVTTLLPAPNAAHADHLA